MGGGTDNVGVALIDAVAEWDADAVNVPESPAHEALGDGLIAQDAVGDRDPVEVGDIDPVADMLGVPLTDAVADEVPVGVSLNDAVGLADADADVEAVGVEVPLSDAVGDPVTVGVSLSDTVGVTLGVRP